MRMTKEGYERKVFELNDCGYFSTSHPFFFQELKMKIILNFVTIQAKEDTFFGMLRKLNEKNINYPNK